MATAVSSSAAPEVEEKMKEGLGWAEWLRGWFYIVYQFLFQGITASHLENPLPLPPVNDLTCIVTGSTSGIGNWRNTTAANELIQKWQNERSGVGLPLNMEVMELDLLSLDSVVRFASAWNARPAPLHVLIVRFKRSSTLYL